MTTSVVNDELRSASRIGVRTPVVVYSLSATGKLVRSRAWTDDLSTTGARITSETHLIGTQIWLRIMLPQLKDQLIEADVIREIAATDTFSRQLADIRRSFYGVRFVGLADDRTIESAQALDLQTQQAKV